MSVPIVLQKHHCTVYSCCETSGKQRQYNSENYLHVGTSQRQKGLANSFQVNQATNMCERNAFYTKRIQGKDNCEMVFTNVTFYKN